MLTIAKLEPSDRATWEVLFRAYMDFYKRTLPQAMYERAWNEFRKDTRMHALPASMRTPPSSHAPVKLQVPQVLV